MQLLGEIGIDFKLLLAQLVNFALLLLILGKFVYRPIIRKIEEDELKLKRAEIKEREIRKERSVFTKKKEEEIAQIKLRSKEIVGEAEKIARSIKKQAAIEAEKLRINLSNKMRKEVEIQMGNYKKDVEKSVKDKTIKKIQANLESFLGSFKGENLLDALFESLIKDIESADIKNIKERKLVESLTKIAGESRVREFIRRKVGRIALEHSHLIGPKQEDRLIKILAKKIGVKPEILRVNKTRNSNLLIGFRLEIAGFIFENSLPGLIKDAV
jgi:F-type H+-transporting ATPase subunit b